MSRNGHSPPVAPTAAIKRKPFILSGFDRKKQCDIEFNTISFGAMWLRRNYTKENHPHITRRCKHDVDAQRVRYGNNIAVLFKACFQLSHGYGSADFWPAIGKGFGATADSVRHMVDVFLAARRLYKLDHPGEDRSGANVAVDKWDDFAWYWRPDAHGTQSNADSINTEAIEYFQDVKGCFVDMAGVLPKEVDHHFHSPSNPRKRSPSPGSCASRSPKRRQSSSYFGQPDSLHSRGPQPLTPVSTGIQIKGSSTKHESQDVEPSGEEVQKTPCIEENYASELFKAIRAPTKTHKAAGSSTGTPPIDTRASMPCNTSPGKYAAEEKSEKYIDREWVETLMDKKVLNAAISDSALKDMQAQIASLAQEVKSVKEENAGLKRQLSKTDLDESIRQMVRRLAPLQDKLLVDGVPEIQAKVAALDSKVTILEASKSQGIDASAAQRLNDRIAPLEEKAISTNATTAASDTAQLIKASNNELWTYAQRLENRITKVEGNQSSGGQPCDLGSELKVVMLRLDRLASANVEAQLEHHKTDTNAKFDQVQRNMNDATKRINSLPSPASVSERVFQVENNLRAEHERYQRDMDKRMEVPVKDIGDVKVQIKCLNKLWNEATAGIAKTESVVTLRGDLDAVKSDIAKLSKGCNSVAAEGSDTSLRDLVTKLQTSVSDLSAKVIKAASEATVALIQANKLQVQMKALQSTEGSSKAKALNVEVLDIRNRLDGLYKAVSMLSELQLVPQ